MYLYELEQYENQFMFWKSFGFQSRIYRTIISTIGLYINLAILFVTPRNNLVRLCKVGILNHREILNRFNDVRLYVLISLFFEQIATEGQNFANIRIWPVRLRSFMSRSTFSYSPFKLNCA